MCLVVRVTFARGTSSRIILNKLALDFTKDDKVSSPVWKQLAEIINKRWASKLSDNDAFQVTTRDVAQAPGYMVSSFPGVMFGPLYFRQLERDQTEALQCNKGVFYAFTISEWWVMHVDSSYNAISHGEPTKVSFFQNYWYPYGLIRQCSHVIYHDLHMLSLHCQWKRLQCKWILQAVPRN